MAGRVDGHDQDRIGEKAADAGEVGHAGRCAEQRKPRLVKRPLAPMHANYSTGTLIATQTAAIAEVCDEAKGDVLWPIFTRVRQRPAERTTVMTGPEDPEGPRRHNPILVSVQSFLHWVIGILALAILGVRLLLRPRLVRFGFIVLLLLAVVGWKMAGDRLPQSTAQAPAPSLTAQALTPAPTAASGSDQATGDFVVVGNGKPLPGSPAAERYLRAQAAYDAETMWSLLSEDLKSSAAESNPNANPQGLQSQLDTAKRMGRRYVGATYVGGVALSSGLNVYLYVLKVETPSGDVEVPFTFVVDSDGKIAGIS